MGPIPYEALFAALPLGLCAVDDEGRILSVNPALERLLGWRNAEWRGRPLSLALEQAICESAQAMGWTVALSQALAQGRTTHLNLPTAFRTGPGDAREVLVTGAVAPWQTSEGESSGALVLFQDRTTWEELEGARARFLAVLAHELGTPATNLEAAAEQLAGHLEPTDTVPWRLLQVIRREVKRLRLRLAQLFPTASGHARAARAQRQLVTLRPLLRQMAYAFEIRGLDCEIAVQAPPDLPFVWSDPDRIQDVLSKLVENAIRYAPAGTEVVLEAKEGEGSVIVSVRDGGPGVPEEDREAIFEPWRRGRHEAPEAQRQGLGLSLARNLVLDLGGRLWYEPSPGGGARFCFSLPQAQNALSEE